MTVTVADPPLTLWHQVGGLWRARGLADATPPPVPDERPSGPGYVTYESLYSNGDTFRQVIGKVTGGNVLTLPAGEFTFTDFNQGYVDGIRLGNGGYTGCGGIAGSGVNSTFIKMVANSSTRAADVAALSSSTGTNPAYLININRMNGCKFLSFTLDGTAQGHEYNGIRVDLCSDAVVSNLRLRGCYPGSHNAPPGETFGININKSPRASIVNTECDGRDPVSGVRNGASPAGWNNTTDGYVGNCYFHHGKTGMLTFWQTNNITVEDTVCHSTATGGGGLSGAGINLENANGVIRIRRTTFRPWGRWEKQHGNTSSDVTDNSALHINVQSYLADVPDVRIYDPVHDRGPHSSGAFAVMIGDAYATSQGGQKVVTMPRIWKGATELIHKDSSSASGANAATHWIRYH